MKSIWQKKLYLFILIHLHHILKLSFSNHSKPSKQVLIDIIIIIIIINIIIIIIIIIIIFIVIITLHDSYSNFLIILHPFLINLHQNRFYQGTIHCHLILYDLVNFIGIYCDYFDRLDFVFFYLGNLLTPLKLIW